MKIAPPLERFIRLDPSQGVLPSRLMILSDLNGAGAPLDIAALGARAIERLCAIIDGGEDQRVEMASPRLVIRETCSGAPGPAPSNTQHGRNREK